MYKLEHDPIDDPMEEPGREIGLADLIHDPNPNAIIVSVGIATGVISGKRYSLVCMRRTNLISFETFSHRLKTIHGYCWYGSTHCHTSQGHENYGEDQVGNVN